MKKIYPTLLVLLLSLLLSFLLFQKGVIDKTAYNYILASSFLFFLLNNIFINLLKNSKGAKSISATMGVSGVTMFVFILTLVLFQVLYKTKIGLPLALSLFVMYVFYKLALFIPVLKKP